SIDALEIEASLSSSFIRLNRLCENYSLRLIQLNKNHLVRQRVSKIFLNSSNGIDLVQKLNYIDWNQNEIISESESEREFQLSQRSNNSRRKRIKRKYYSQLICLCSMIKDTLSDQDVERFDAN